MQSGSLDLQQFVRDIPNFPTEGILFRDITPLLGNVQALRLACDAMAAPFRNSGVEVVAAAEARGFIFAAPIAMALGAGFVPIRKPGKLPFDRRTFHYDLEYGSDTLEIHIDGVKPGQRVLVVDDLLATGGTVEACCRLLEQAGAQIVGCSFLIHLVALGGHLRLSPHEVRSVIEYDDDEETNSSIQNRQPGPAV
jgi:adenine phosphoribosyltransferase